MIKKTDLINGLSYVEIPEADIYIQCGTPAESVKHLIKNKIIHSVTKNGVTFETGPNAILLSDIMIQNGEFSNMSEFSVLQMLYRQGLILPGHPNNTGIKPVIIGLSSQVSAQMQYIYRGNYGLISQEEIEACGIDSNQAKELMNIKLKFAFGKLQPPDSLLESCIVEKEKIEIRNKVFIQRKEHNIFEITYKDESVEVDLNLKKNQTYPSPYSLPQYNVKRDYFSVIHTGQGDGWDIKRPSMNSIISFQGKLYVIDLVPNFKYILEALSIDINEIEGVFQTHTHDDHFAGITSLIRSDKKIKFYASKLVISATAKKLSSLLDFDESEFYNLVDARELDIDKWNNIDGLEVRPYLSPHPVETTIFVFRALYGAGYKTYGHFADIIDVNILKDMITENSDEIGISKEFFDEVIVNYKQNLDLKKIDIGGGMIHGNAKDFEDDKSSKIILAHTSQELTQDEKKIGSGSLFGMSDVLISSKNNYDVGLIYRYIKLNFPHLSRDQINIFLNFNIIELNPEAIIIREDENIKYAYLILGGQIEMIRTNENDSIILTPGVIIGEKTTLTNELPQSTYISKNFVKLLEIPIDLFYNFINKNNLMEDMLGNTLIRLTLLKMNLFSEAITYSTLNKIIEELEEEEECEGVLDVQSDRLYIILAGEVTVKVNGMVIETLSKLDHFGGVQAVLNYPSLCNFEVAEDTILYSMSGNILKDIPIIRWKILETYELQKEKFLKVQVLDENDNRFLWKEAYKIKVKEMDNHHKRIFEIINNLNICLKSSNCNEVEDILNSLVDYSKYHFDKEEEFMEKYEYKNLEHHKEQHQKFKDNLYIFRDDINSNSSEANKLLNILHDWLVDHILEEDTQYSKLLNERGVF